MKLQAAKIEGKVLCSSMMKVAEGWELSLSTRLGVSFRSAQIEFRFSTIAGFEKEAAHFDLVPESPSKPHQPVTYRYVFRESWRYVLRIQPNVITKVRQHDEALEAAINAIDSVLERNQHRGRLDSLLHGGGYKWWRWTGREPKDGCYTPRRPFRNIPLHALIIEE